MYQADKKKKGENSLVSVGNKSRHDDAHWEDTISNVQDTDGLFPLALSVGSNTQ